MTLDEESEWRQLCAMAAVETDHQKLVELAERINRLLEKREHKLRPQSSPSADPPAEKDRS